MGENRTDRAWGFDVLRIRRAAAHKTGLIGCSRKSVDREYKWILQRVERIIMCRNKIGIFEKKAIMKVCLSIVCVMVTMVGVTHATIVDSDAVRGSGVTVEGAIIMPSKLKSLGGV